MSRQSPGSVPEQHSRLPALAMVVGDPQRVLQAVEMLEEPCEVWQVREYLAWRGLYRGVPVLAASHGLGASSASLAFEHLFRNGVHTIFRAGTCGALRPDICPGTLVIPTAAIRDDGVSEQVLPLAVPAVADAQLVQALQDQAARGRVSTISGLVWSAGVFYESPHVPARVRTWLDSGAVAVEMEMAVLFVMASRYQARAAGILAVEGGAEEDLDPWNRPLDDALNRSAIQAMIEITLNALVQAGDETRYSDLNSVRIGDPANKEGFC